jgi:hypothetical protein
LTTHAIDPGQSSQGKSEARSNFIGGHENLLSTSMPKGNAWPEIISQLGMP